MADKENTNMEVDKGRNKPPHNQEKPLADELSQRLGDRDGVGGKEAAAERRATAEYIAKHYKTGEKLSDENFA